jgi:2-keto-4-pentenoate hydratase/2-oxohepta-3-ene-1,7-dioic acid hydratase in catechol pathway
MIETGIVDLAPLLDGGEPQAMLERLIDHRDQLADPIAKLCETGTALALGSVSLRAVLRLPVGERDLRLQPELGIVIRGPARDVAPDAWQDAVFGYTGFLDVARPGSGLGPAGRDDWWKSWDTAFAVGPAIVTVDEGAPRRGPALVVTDGSGTITTQDPEAPALSEIIAFLSSVMTLRSGDLIACGAHEAAVIDAVPGSHVRMDVPGTGSLSVQVAA